MISRPLTRVVNSTEMFVAPGITISAEGSALVRVAGAQSAGVQPSAATGTQAFVGFSFAGTSAYPFPEGQGNKVETFTVGVGGQVTLARTPTNGAVSVINVDTKAPATGFTVTGAVVSGLTIGTTVAITYRYDLTAIEAVALYGNVQPGGYSGAYLGASGQIGVITRGFVMTGEYDPSVNWAAAGTTGNILVAGAGGVITLGAGDGTDGAVIPGTVTRTPDEGYPFVGIEFSANA